MRRSTFWKCAILFLLSTWQMGWAQGSGTSTVAGTVVDSSGAMVQSANVEVRDKNTNVARRTSTNGAGQLAAC